MKLAIFSAPEYYEGEEKLVETFLGAGLEYFHLRKPGWEETQFHKYLKKIHPIFYRKIILHGGFGLIKKYNLKGIHLNGEAIKMRKLEELKYIMKGARIRGLKISSSAHCFEELEQYGKNFSHLFLSPVFDSISKKGYKTGFNLNEIKEKLDKRREERSATEIWGLGGINSENLPKVFQAGFTGAAVLGTIWNRYTSGGADMAFDEFENLKQAYSLSKENDRETFTS
ncbi:thiamine phosphate synthase [Cytophagaceae bacterium ABcell3]|nr:thiamine phosphate synthase [Cytophagaceae bacterium ABcell3]